MQIIGRGSGASHRTTVSVGLQLESAVRDESTSEMEEIGSEHKNGRLGVSDGASSFVKTHPSCEKGIVANIR